MRFAEQRVPNVLAVHFKLHSRNVFMPNVNLEQKLIMRIPVRMTAQKLILDNVDRLIALFKLRNDAVGHGTIWRYFNKCTAL